MSCQCHQVGGPFIAEDPDCPAHGVGGYAEQVEVLQERVARLEAEIARLEALFPERAARGYYC